MPSSACEMLGGSSNRRMAATRRINLTTATFLVLALVFPPRGHAEERRGDLSVRSPRAAWTGGPFTASMPAECPDPAVFATCDVFKLRVIAPFGWLVGIDIDAMDPQDDYDIFVRQGGVVVASGTNQTGSERVLVVHGANAGTVYEITVQPTRIAPGSHYRGRATLQRDVRFSRHIGHAETRNIRPVGTFGYPGGSDLDFDGRNVYAGQLGNKAGGIHIFDVSAKEPRRVGFLACSGYQNDVAVVQRGVIAVGFHSSECGDARVSSGLRLVDATAPSLPTLLGAVGFPGGAHTITKFPGRPLVYASPGGAAFAERPPTEREPEGATQYIIDVSDLSNPKIVHRFEPNVLGCHDVSFFVRARRQLGFCAGSNETIIWDVSKPETPRVLARIVNGAFFHHSVLASPDGKLLVIGDEAYTAHECSAGGPTGALWIYDISKETSPRLVGFVGPPRGDRAAAAAEIGEWCTAHNYNFISGTRTLVTSWYSGGTSVIDLTNPSLPVEVAFFRPVNAFTWSSYWFDGRIYASDLNRGLDVLELSVPTPRS